MHKIEAKLKKPGFEMLPTKPYSNPNRTSAVQVSNLLFLSGHGTGRWRGAGNQGGELHTNCSNSPQVWRWCMCRIKVQARR